MVPLLLRFVAGARAAGLRISTSEVLDCLCHLGFVDPLEEAQFKSVLQANFAKSRREQAHFERLYRLFFHELRQDPSIARSPDLAEPIRVILQALQAAAGTDPSLGALIDFLAGNPAGLLGRLPPPAGGGRPQAGRAAAGGGAGGRRLELLERIRMLEEQLAQTMADRRDAWGWEERRDLAEHFQDRLDACGGCCPSPLNTTRPWERENSPTGTSSTNWGRCISLP